MAETAVDAMKRTCDFIVAGDYMAAMAELTPEAMNEAMALAAGLTAAPVPTSYVIDREDVTDGDHRFSVRLLAPPQELVAWTTWREIEGAWKIVSIGIEA